MDWSRFTKESELEPALRKYRRYLENLGFSTQTTESYLFRCKKYLEFSHTDMPSEENFTEFRDYLQNKKLARNTMNNYGFATRKYHEMIGRPVSFRYVRLNDTIPYFFDEADIAKIFNVCHNLKHYAMLVTMFYEALRVSELCGLNDDDLDFENMSLGVRGKWRKETIIPLNESSQPTLCLCSKPAIENLLRLKKNYPALSNASSQRSAIFDSSFFPNIIVEMPLINKHNPIDDLSLFC